MTDKVVYDTKAFEAAHRRFLTDPKTVTDDDLALIELVFPSFAERARAMRAGFVNAQTAEDRTLGKEPIRAKFFIDWIANYLAPIHATHRYKGQQAQAQIEWQWKEIESLKARVLELEAERASRTPDHVSATQHD